MGLGPWLCAQHLCWLVSVLVLLKVVACGWVGGWIRFAVRCCVRVASR